MFDIFYDTEKGFHYNFEFIKEGRSVFHFSMTGMRSFMKEMCGEMKKKPEYLLQLLHHKWVCL